MTTYEFDADTETGYRDYRAEYFAACEAFHKATTTEARTALMNLCYVISEEADEAGEDIDAVCFELFELALKSAEVSH